MELVSFVKQAKDLMMNLFKDILFMIKSSITRSLSKFALFWETSRKNALTKLETSKKCGKMTEKNTYLITKTN